MDKYEYNVKSDQIKKLYSRKEFEAAAKIADEIDWYRVKDNTMINRVADIYENVRQYEKAKEVLLIAYERSPLGRQLAYKLTILALRTKNFVEADEFYQDFVEMSPSDVSQYLLKYRIAKAKGEDIEVLIKILEAYIDVEMDERWQYELAKLYHEAGMDDKCVAMCDELELWFNDGKYVEKAKELKRLITGMLSEYHKRYANPAHAAENNSQTDNENSSDMGEVSEEDKTGIQSLAEAIVASETEKQTRMEDRRREEQEAVQEVEDGLEPLDDSLREEEDFLDDDIHPEETRKAEVEAAAREVAKRAAEAEASMPAETEEERMANEALKAAEAAALEAQKAADMAKQLVMEARLRAEQVKAVTKSEPSRFNGMTAEEIGKTLEDEEILKGNMNINRKDSMIEIFEFDKNKDGKCSNIGEELTKTAEIDVDQINVKLAEADNLYNTANIQAALAKSMEKLLDAERKKVRNAFTTQIDDEADEIRPIEGYEGEDDYLADETPAEEQLAKPAKKAEPQMKVEPTQVTEPQAEAEPTQVAEPQAEAEPTQVTEPQAETESSQVTESQAEAESSQVTELQAETESSQVAEPQAETEPIQVTEPQAEAESIQVTEPRAEAEPKQVTEPQAEVEPKQETEEESLTDDFTNEEFDGEPTKRIDRAELNRILNASKMIHLSEQDTATEGVQAETEQEDEQIEGQMTIDEVLAEYERIQAEKEAEDDAVKAEESAEEASVSGISSANNDKKAADEKKETAGSLSKSVGKHKIPEEYKSLFSDFVGTGSMEEVIADTLDNLINNFVMDGTSRTNNVIITGSAKVGKTTLGLSLIKAANRGRSRSGRRVAKVKASALNKRGVALAMTQILGTDLIIEQAGNLMPNSIVDLMIAMKNYTEEMLIVLEDDKAAIDRMLEHAPDLKEFFTNRLDIHEMEINDMVKIAKEYAEEQFYVIDEIGELALYAKLDDISGHNPVMSIEDIQEVIDEAIEHANRFSLGKIFGKMRKNKGEMRTLTEADFF